MVVVLVPFVSHHGDSRCQRCDGIEALVFVILVAQTGLNVKQHSRLGPKGLGTSVCQGCCWSLPRWKVEQREVEHERGEITKRKELTWQL